MFDPPCALPDRADDSPLPVADLVVYRQKLAEWIKLIDDYRGYRLDLRATNLQRADLSDLNLADARLDAARMQGGKNQRGADAWGNLVLRTNSPTVIATNMDRADHP